MPIGVHTENASKDIHKRSQLAAWNDLVYVFHNDLAKQVFLPLRLEEVEFDPISTSEPQHERHPLVVVAKKNRQKTRLGANGRHKGTNYVGTNGYVYLVKKPEKETETLF